MSRVASCLLAVAVALSLTACGGKPQIDDATVAKYIKAYTGLKKVSPKLAADLRQSHDGVTAGQAGFTAVEKVIRDAGFSGYPEFVTVNAAIGMAFSQVQAGAFMADMDKMQKAGGAQIEAALANPNVPESVKAQLKAQKQAVAQEYAKNKGWADWVMGYVGMANDSKALDVVKRHRQELQAAFTSR